MIDFNKDIQRIIFSGDVDQPVVITKLDGTVISTTGIFRYQVANAQLDNVSISDARKLTLTLSTKALSDLNCIIEDTDTFTVDGKTYGQVTAPFDSQHGLITLQLGDL